jgi:hypothetical protein
MEQLRKLARIVLNDPTGKIANAIINEANKK